MIFQKEFIDRIYRLGFLLVLILAVADLLVFFYYPDTVFGEIFLATRERTPMTWISALSLFFIGLASFWAYMSGKGKVWFFLALSYLFFSMDDATYFHERLSGHIAENTTLFANFPTYIWVVLYFPLLVFALVGLVLKLWDGATRKQRKTIIAALIFLAAAISFDLVDGFVAKNPILVFCLAETCHEGVLHLLRLSEEVLEIFALGILGYFTIHRHCIDEQNI